MKLYELRIKSVFDNTLVINRFITDDLITISICGGIDDIDVRLDVTKAKKLIKSLTKQINEIEKL